MRKRRRQKEGGTDRGCVGGRKAIGRGGEGKQEREGERGEITKLVRAERGGRREAEVLVGGCKGVRFRFRVQGFRVQGSGFRV